MSFKFPKKTTETNPSAGSVNVYVSSTDDSFRYRKSDGTEISTAGSGSSETSEVSKTSDYFLTYADCNGSTIFNNNGSTGIIKFYLPSVNSIANPGIDNSTVIIKNTSVTYKIRVETVDNVNINAPNLSYFQVVLKPNQYVVFQMIENEWYVMNNIEVDYGVDVVDILENYEVNDTYGYVDSVGTTWMLGTNTYGFLGDNSVVSRRSPVSVVGGHTFCRISMGSTTVYGLKSDGSVWSWGRNNLGQLGDNSITDKCTPVQVCGNHTFCSISVGSNFILGLKNDGSFMGWGYNASGELGDNTTVSKCTPISVCNLLYIPYKNIYGGILYHSVGLSLNGTLFSWGRNQYGELGDGTAISKCTPISVCGNHTFIKGSTGGTFTIALKTDGSVWGWGLNSSGQLGLGNGTSRTTPVQVCGNHTFCQISAGLTHTVAIRNDGSVWSWGRNTEGQLGDGTTTNKCTPISVCGNHTFCQISAGGEFTIALKSDGSVWSWGLNTYGQLGDGTTTNKCTPISVCGNHTFCQISTGRYHTIGLKQDGTLWSWGRNDVCALGDGTTTARCEPVSVCGNHTFCSISTGGSITLAVKSDGSVWSWGNNNYGALGDGTTTARCEPVSVCGNHTFCQIDGGEGFSLAIKSDGSVWSWGLNTYGQLGDGTVTSRLTPISVCKSAQPVCFVEGLSSYGHSLGLTNDGYLFRWGSTTYSFFPNIINVSTPTFVNDTNLTSIKKIISKDIFWKLDDSVYLVGPTQGFPINSYTELAQTFYCRCSLQVCTYNISPNDFFYTGNPIDATKDIYYMQGRGLWSWGYTPTYDLLNPSKKSISTQNATQSPTEIQDVLKSAITFRKISNQSPTYAIDTNNKMWMWGDNTKGYFQSELNTPRWASIQKDIKVCAIFGDYKKKYIKDDSGNIWFWGELSNFPKASNENKCANLIQNSLTKIFDASWCVQELAVFNDSKQFNMLLGSSLWSWGLNQYGEIGDGTTVSKVSPTITCGCGNTGSISIGLYRILNKFTDNMFGVDLNNGGIFVWGRNDYGQLGVGDITNKSVLNSKIYDFCSIYTDGNSTLGLKSNGSLWAWGYNLQGQLGDGTITCRCTPVSVFGNHTFCQVFISGGSSFGLKSNGSLWAWGRNTEGQLGDNSIINKYTPVSVYGGHTFCQIATVGFSTLGLKSDGSLYAWGLNNYGMLGDNTIVNKCTPVSVLGNHTFRSIYISGNHSLGLKSNGSLWSWGLNERGQLGDNSIVSRLTPVSVCGNHTFCEIYTGGSNTYGIKSDKTFWSWGYNVYGQLGDGTITSRLEPISVCGNHTFCQIYTMGGSTLITLKLDGSVWSWGYNFYGQLGDGTITCRCTPVSVCGNHTFCQISNGNANTFALKSDGTLYSWGYNLYGQLGDASTISKRIPTSILGLFQNFGYCDISVGLNHILSLDRNGVAWSWGLNTYGQLGTYDTTSRNTPTSVCGGHVFSSVFAGYYHSIGLKNGTTAYTWGRNDYGQLGNGTTTSCNSPISVCGNHTFRSISTQGYHNLGLKGDGSLWSWGRNSYGQLGDNSTTNRCTPVQVCGIHSFCSVFAGYYHNLALKSDGSLWSWGRNTYGQLGDSTYTNKCTPVQVCTSHTFSKIYIPINSNQSFAIKQDGSLYSWGDNSFNALGQNIETYIQKPIPITL